MGGSGENWKAALSGGCSRRTGTSARRWMSLEVEVWLEKADAPET